MARVTETPTRAWAHCIRPPVEHVGLCAGVEQVEVDAIQRLCEFTFADCLGPHTSEAQTSGALLKAVERSVIQLLFVNPDDAVCPHCGGRRELTDQIREQYKNHGFGAPDMLTKILSTPGGIAEFERRREQAERRQKLIDEHKIRHEAEAEFKREQEENGNGEPVAKKPRAS